MFKKFKYDLAFSFAEEDRSIAESIARELRLKKVRNYYLYTEQQERQFGKDLFEVTLDVYRNSRFIVLICSKHFISGYWSGIEQRAMTSNFKKIQGRIFPIRTDETKLSILPGSVIYEKWDNDPAKIAGYIANRIKIEKRKEQILRAIILTGGIICAFLILWLSVVPPVPPCKPFIGTNPGDAVMVCFQRKGKRTNSETSIRDTFYLSNTEVTVKQYKEFCDSIGKNPPSQPFPELDNNPVVNITWDEALAFCRWKRGRLPTEEEWEYAASAGLDDKYSGGNNAKKIAVFGVKKFQAVAKKCPNAFGLYDMSGNVAEWCDTDSLSKYKIIKGGSHKDGIAALLVSARDSQHHSFNSNSIGFRIAWDQKQSH